MYQWLPVINRLIPGSGITYLNVWDTPFLWWRIHRDHAAALVDAMSKETARG